MMIMRIDNLYLFLINHLHNVCMDKIPAKPVCPAIFVESVETAYTLISALSNLCHGQDWTELLVGSVGALRAWDPLESTCRHASLSIL